MSLPNLVVIGAMKCATSALHQQLASHPQIHMADPKELNFFNGTKRPRHDDESRWWVTGQWHRGVDWYAGQFDPAAPVRGESSPAYTSPSFPEVAGRMASVVPRARLVYLVRDPVHRALSQFAHHRRDGTELRGPAAAILDPRSQYLARSRYAERLEPFLRRYPRSQVHVVVQERLRRDPGRVLREVHRHAGADPELGHTRHPYPPERGSGPAVSDRLRAAVWERVRDDVERLQAFLRDDLDEWHRP